MPKIFLAVMVAVSMMWGAEGLKWADSFEAAKTAAKAQNKKVMLMLSQAGCPTCEYMRSVVFRNDDVVAAVSSRFVPVEIDISVDRVPAGFRAYGTPTFYFTDANGNKIGRQLVGGAKPEAFIQAISQVK